MSLLRPDTLEAALEIRARQDVVPLAGGTDVFPARSLGEAWGHPPKAPLLDLSAIAALRGIEEDADGHRIGALVTWSEVMRHPLPAHFEGLKAAGREVGGHQIQNRGTLVGNLCNASPAADGTPVLLVLEAEIELASLAGSRRLPLIEFTTGNRETVLRPDELAIALHVPRPASAAPSAFLKLGSRRYLVISIAVVAGSLELDDDGRIAEARLAVGACSPVPCRLSELERALRGLRIDDSFDPAIGETVPPALSPIDDARATAAYRLEAAQILLARLLTRVAAGRGRRAA